MKKSILELHIQKIKKHIHLLLLYVYVFDVLKNINTKYCYHCGIENHYIIRKKIKKIIT